jgi:hypothetical protein
MNRTIPQRTPGLLDFDLSDPRLDSDAPPAFACGECDQTRAAAELALFANARLRARLSDLEHALALALELLDALQAPAVFADEAPTDADAFGLLDPPTLVRVLEIVPDPFAVAAGAPSGDECGCFERCVVGRCGDKCVRGFAYTCTLAPGHTGLHAVTGSEGRPSVVWGRSRV